MPDFLTLLAQSQGPRPAVIDDRPDGTLICWTFAELEANANRLGRVFRDRGCKTEGQDHLVRPQLALGGGGRHGGAQDWRGGGAAELPADR